MLLPHPQPLATQRGCDSHACLPVNLISASPDVAYAKLTRGLESHRIACVKGPSAGSTPESLICKRDRKDADLVIVVNPAKHGILELVGAGIFLEFRSGDPLTTLYNSRHQKCERFRCDGTLDHSCESHLLEAKSRTVPVLSTNHIKDTSWPPVEYALCMVWATLANASLMRRNMNQAFSAQSQYPGGASCWRCPVISVWLVMPT